MRTYPSPELKRRRRRVPHHPSEMLERPGPLVAWFYRTFFRHVRVDPRYAELVRALAAEGTVVYVMRSRNLINYLFFNALCLSLGLPLARFANGISLLWWQPFWVILRYFWAWLRGRRLPPPEVALRETVARGEAAALFLRKPRTLTTLSNHQERFIPELLALQRERNEPIFLVPQLLIWERRPARLRRSLLDVIFGEISDPGLLRQLWLFFMNYKRAMVKVGDPVDLREYAEAARDDEAIARNVRGKIIAYLAREFRVVLGPQTKEPHKIKDEIVRGRGLRDRLIELSREEEVPVEELEKKARKLLDEIAATMDFRTVEVFGWILEKIFVRIFDGIEYSPEEFARVRDAARKGPLLLVPSHKSHVDYLLVSFLFYREDLMPPHIAAGDNLSFWPLGALFRRAGAFFLRRSFKGDRLYAAVFRAYVRRLVRDGHNIEFFIEGGRSRSGKLLQPKLGLLGMVVDACLGGTGKDVQVVPISIVYEKVLEDKSYQKELMGGQKKAESMGEVLKASKVLGSSYGRIYMHFDESFSLQDFLSSRGLTPAEPGAEYRTAPPDPELVRPVVQELAYRIVNGINRVTVVTPSALVATTLLTHPRRGMARPELEARCAFLLDFLRRKKALLSQALQGDPRGPEVAEALQQAIFLFHKNGYVTIHDQEDFAVYSVNADWRPSLDYYKNNLIHHLIEPALVATALFQVGPLPEEAAPNPDQSAWYKNLSAEVKSLSRLFKHEFIFSTDIPFEESLSRTLTQLKEYGFLSPSYAPTTKGLPYLKFFRALLLNFFESIWIVLCALEVLEEKPLPEKEFLRQIRSYGERLYLVGDVRRREACLTLNYQNALTLLLERGVVSLKPAREAKARPLYELSPPYREKEARQKLEEEVVRYLKNTE